MKEITINPLGIVVQNKDGSSTIQIDETFRAGLKGLAGFSHLVVVWWANKADDRVARGTLDAGMPYRYSTEPLGVFATRSPMRPNPVCISSIAVASIDESAGCIETYYFDAEEGTPLIDIKPYVPSVDRVCAPQVLAWCTHWPQDVETSGDFDWQSEFRF